MINKLHKAAYDVLMTADPREKSRLANELYAEAQSGFERDEPLRRLSRYPIRADPRSLSWCVRAIWPSVVYIAKKVGLCWLTRWRILNSTLSISP